MKPIRAYHQEYMKTPFKTSNDNQNDVEDSGCCNQSWCWWTPRQNTIPVAFCHETSIHGFKFLGQEKRHLSERIFWLLGFCVSLATVSYLMYSVYEQYMRVPVIVSFQSHEQNVDSIPFPAVTICNMNKFPKKKVEELMRIADDDGDAQQEKAKRELVFVRNACNAQMSFAKHFDFAYSRGASVDEKRETILPNKNENKNDNVTDKDMLDLTDFLLFNTLPCDQLIRYCMLGDENATCGDIFKPIMTDYGKCCSFNILPLPLLLQDPDKDSDSPYHNPVLGSRSSEIWPPTELAKWDQWNYDEGFVLHGKGEKPWRQKRAGLPYGLSLLIDPHLDEYYCPASDSLGIRYILHTPLEMPQVWEFSSLAHLGKEILVEIHPDVTNADIDIRGIEPHRRLCYFGKERSLRYYGPYTGGNCIEECTVDFISLRCNCTPFFMPRAHGIGICDSDPLSKDYKCADDSRIELQSHLKEDCDHCEPLCEDIAYNYETTIAELQHHSDLWSDAHPTVHANGNHEEWGNHSMAVVHFFFGAESTVPKYRKRLYGTTDLIANTGGILGLCLGFSILSGVEVIYFFTLRAYWKFCRRRMLKKRRDRQQRQDQHVSNGFLSQLLFHRKSTNKVIQVNPQMIPIYNSNGPTTNPYGGTMPMGRRGWGNSQGHHFYGSTSFAPKYNLPAHYGYKMY